MWWWLGCTPLWTPAPPIPDGTPVGFELAVTADGMRRTEVIRDGAIAQLGCDPEAVITVASPIRATFPVRATPGPVDGLALRLVFAGHDYFGWVLRDGEATMTELDPRTGASWHFAGRVEAPARGSDTALDTASAYDTAANAPEGGVPGVVDIALAWTPPLSTSPPSCFCNVGFCEAGDGP